MSAPNVVSNRGQSVLTAFYSRNNVQLLYDALRHTIKDSLHYDLTGDEYMAQLMNIMQSKVQEFGANLPQNTQTLNKRVLDSAIPLFIQNIQMTRQQQQQQQQPAQRPYQMQNSQGGVRVAPQPQATQRTPNGGGPMTGQVEHMFNQLVEDRGTTAPQRQVIPNFQDPVPQHQPDVSQIYQLEDQRRQQSDVIPPPDPRQLQMLPPNVANNIRGTPALYSNPAQQPNFPQLQTQQTHPTQQQIQQMQQRMQMQPQPMPMQQQSMQQQQPMQQPMQHEGFNPQDFATGMTHTPPQMSSVPQHAMDYQFDEQAAAMNNFDPKNDQGGFDGPPQPRQLRVLIPETSRGTVAKSEMIPQIFTVDSRDRDDTAYPDPASYRIRLPEFKNVISIELVAAEVPTTGYVVNETNNILHYQEEDGITLQAQIPIGNYSPDDLVTAIETAMTSGFGVTYDVTNNTTTNTFTIEAVGGAAPAFNLIFFGGTVPFSSSNEPNMKTKSIYEQNSIGPVIGFDKVDLSGSTTYTGQQRYNLGGPKNLYLHIEEADLIQSNDSNVHKAFAKIPLNGPLGSTVFYQRNEDYPYIKHFSAEVGRLSHLTIQWKTHDGLLYDFNGDTHNHVLTFEIIVRDITKPKY